MMRWKSDFYFRRLFAVLTIVSFTFTQCFPAWAAPGLKRQTLRQRAPERGTPAFAGLEERFKREAQGESAFSTKLVTASPAKIPQPVQTRYGVAQLDEETARQRLRNETGEGWARSFVDWKALTRKGRKVEEIAWNVWFQGVYRDGAYGFIQPDRDAIRERVHSRLDADYGRLSDDERARVLDEVIAIEQDRYPQARMLAALERYRPERIELLRSGRGTPEERIAALRGAVGWLLLVEEDNQTWLGNERLWMSLLVRLLDPRNAKLAEQVQRELDVLTGSCSTCGIQALRNYPDALAEEIPLRGEAAAPEFFMASMVGAIDAVYNDRIPGALKTTPAPPHPGHSDTRRFATSAYALAKYQGLSGVELLAKGEDLLTVIGQVASEASPVMIETINPIDQATGAAHAVVVYRVTDNAVLFIDNEVPGILPRDVFLEKYQPTGVALLSGEQRAAIEKEYQVELREEDLKAKVWCCGIVWFIGDFNGLQVVLEALRTLFYRAPDASGVSKLLSDLVRQAKAGRLDTMQEKLARKVIGAAPKLYYYLTSNPIFKDGATPEVARAAWQEAALREGISPEGGRDLSVPAGFTMGSLYGYEQGGEPPAGKPIQNGIDLGDHGSDSAEILFKLDPTFKVLQRMMVDHGVPRELLKQLIRRVLIGQLRKTLTWEDKFVLDAEERAKLYSGETQFLADVVDRLAKNAPLPPDIDGLTGRSRYEGAEPIEPLGDRPDGLSTPQGRVDLDEVGFPSLGVVAAPVEETWTWTEAEIGDARNLAWEQSAVRIDDEVGYKPEDFKYIPKETVEDRDSRGQVRKRTRIAVNFGYGAHISGKVRFGRGVTVGAGAFLRNVSVGANTVIGEAAVVENSVLAPRVKVGREVKIHDSELGLGVEAEGSTTVIGNSVLASGVFVDSSQIDHYEIAKNTKVVNSILTMRPDDRRGIGFFGILDGKGKPNKAATGMETGEMAVWLYPGLTLAEAVRVGSKLLDSRFQELYRHKLEEYIADLKAQRTHPRRGLLGYVGQGSRINGAKEVRGALIGDYADINNPGTIFNTTILSDQENPTEVSDGTNVLDAILQWGVVATDHASVSRSMVLEHAEVKHREAVKKSIVGPNSSFELGELTSSLVGAFTVSHHQTTIIGAWIPEHGVNFGAGVQFGSNHPGTMPQQLGTARRGTFFGLSMSQQFPFTGGPYSFYGFGLKILQGKAIAPFSVARAPEQIYTPDMETLALPSEADGAVPVFESKVRIERLGDRQLRCYCFPLKDKASQKQGNSYAAGGVVYAVVEDVPIPEVWKSVILTKAGGIWIYRDNEGTIVMHYRPPTISPAFGRFQPGGVLGGNPFKLLRDQMKWQTRDKTTRHRFNFEVFQPETVDEMIAARDLFAMEPEVIREVYTDADVIGHGSNGKPITYRGFIGKTYLTEEDRRLAAVNYTGYIRLYALTGLKFRLSEIIKEGVKGWEDLKQRLAARTNSVRWEHERRVLELEMGKPLADATAEDIQKWLKEADQLKKLQYKLVYASRNKDWERGIDVTEGYAETHGAVPNSTRFKVLLERYEKIFDFKFTEARDPVIAQEAKTTEGAAKVESWWQEIYGFLEDLELRIPADFDDDLLRDTFRKIDTEIVASFVVHPEWAEQVEAEFRNLVTDKGGDKRLSWLEAWNLERKANRAGLAAAAAVAWFQKRAVQEGAIPQALIDDGTIRFGVLDPLTAQLLPDDDLSHGRWSTAGLNSLFGAQPILTPDGTGAVALNGDVGRLVNAHARANLSKRYPFVSKNDTETIAVQWHDNRKATKRGELEETIKADWPAAEAARQMEFLRKLDQNGITDPDERAARLAGFQLSPGTSWAVALSSIENLPRRRFGMSHNRPVSLIRLTGSPNLLIASDPVAALGWFPEPKREEASRQIHQLREERDRQIKAIEAEAAQKEIPDKERRISELAQATEQEVQRILEGFGVEALELMGEDKFFKTYRVIDPATRKVVSRVEVTHYDGQPYIVREQERAKSAGAEEEILGWKTLKLDPTSINKGLFEHVQEIPGIYKENAQLDVQGGRVNVAAETDNGVIKRPGLNRPVWTGRFGNKLEGLQKIRLNGYGSSNRAARIVAPLFERLLPNVIVEGIPPPEVIIGIEQQEFIPDPQTDADVNISYSGETHGMVLLMNLLKKITKTVGDLRGVVQVAVSGKPSSTLYRAMLQDTGHGEGGSLDIRSGPEQTIATVKGIAAQIQKLVELAIQLAQEMEMEEELRQHLIEQLQQLGRLAERVIPVEGSPAFAEASARADRMGKMAEEFFAPRRLQTVSGIVEQPSEYNQMIVLGGDWSGYEGELKGEEISTVPAYFATFRQIERVFGLLLRQAERKQRDPKAKRALLIIDDTFAQWHPEARAAIRMFQALASELGFKFVVNTAFPEDSALKEAENSEAVRLVTTPKVDDYLQATLTLPFYDWFGTQLALARGLTYQQANQPKNLAKSVVVGVSTMEEKLEKLRAVILELGNYLKLARPESDLGGYKKQLAERVEQRGGVEFSIGRTPLLLQQAAQAVAPDGRQILLSSSHMDGTVRKELLKRFGTEVGQLRDVVLLVDSDLGYAVAKGIEYQLRYLLHGASVRIRFVGEQVKVLRDRTFVVGIATPGLDRGLADAVNRLTDTGVATFTLNDPAGDKTAQPRTTVGSISYPQQTDRNNFYGIAYTYLLGLTLTLGQLNGSVTNGPDYAKGIQTVWSQAVEVHQSDTLQTDMQNAFRNILSDPNIEHLDRVQIIAGRQSYGSAWALAYYLNVWAGVHAEVLLLDESYHGPLAVVPEIPVFVFATDDYAFPQALYDGGVNKSKGGNVAVILQEGDDEISEGVRDLRPDSLIRVPKLPDSLVNPVDGMFAMRFALEWAKAAGEASGFSGEEIVGQVNTARLDELVKQFDEQVRRNRVQSTSTSVPDLLVVAKDDTPEGRSVFVKVPPPSWAEPMDSMPQMIERLRQKFGLALQDLPRREQVERMLTRIFETSHRENKTAIGVAASGLDSHPSMIGIASRINEPVQIISVLNAISKEAITSLGKFINFRQPIESGSIGKVSVFLFAVNVEPKETVRKLGAKGVVNLLGKIVGAVEQLSLPIKPAPEKGAGMEEIKNITGHLDKMVDITLKEEYLAVLAHAPLELSPLLQEELGITSQEDVERLRAMFLSGNPEQVNEAWLQLVSALAYLSFMAESYREARQERLAEFLEELVGFISEVERAADSLHTALQERSRPAGLEEAPVEAAVKKVHELSMELLQALMARKPEPGRVLEILGAPKNLDIRDLAEALSFVRAHPNSHVESFKPGGDEKPDRVFLGSFRDEELQASILPVLEGIAAGLTQRIGDLTPPAGLEETAVAVAPIKTIPALKRVLLGQVERIQVTEEVVNSKVLIVTPDALPKLVLAWSISGPNNRPLVVEALAQDQAQKERVEIVLRGLGIAGVRVHDVENEFPGRDAAVAANELFKRHETEGRKPFIVNRKTSLEELLEFLERPDAIGQVKELWFIADRSQQIWS